MITFHQLGYQNFKTYYIHFVCRYLTNKFPELVSYTRMLTLMQDILVQLCSYFTHRQGLPSLIRSSYRFVITYAFSNFRFLKIPISEEKERCDCSTIPNYTLLSMSKVV
ncbi:Mobile element protein [Candidatus Enterovibrio escicola]|uniref:Mobile element protein n=1 Tax=Candidatus Enterovibrio escicola TaxID=1927127 RepID=A0A2A5T4T4_9GAMM|nr:hypothetical protein [Candidatus Enterovibrio escacola]PCS23182.1 Mobile element protein [Candidatus Enterovibrio escacola]